MSGNGSYIKSMNGIVSFDSGGTIIEGDEISTGTIDSTTINSTTINSTTINCEDLNATVSVNSPYVKTDFIFSDTNLTFNSTASTTYNFSVPTQLQAVNSTLAASTAYVRTAISNVLNGDTYTGTQNFTGATITVPTKTSTDNSTNAASTAYVTTAIANVLNGESYTGAQNFTGATITATTQSSLINDTTVATTAFTNTAVTNLKSTANTWSQAQNFTGAVLTAFTQTASDSTTKVATTNFVSTAIANVLNGETYTGTQNFTGATLTATTKAVGTNTTDVATTAFVLANAGTAGLLSGTNTWSGVSNTFNNSIFAPTKAVGTNTTDVATCAFVLANASSAILSATNTFTGVSNTFETLIKIGTAAGSQILVYPTTIESKNGSDTIGVFNNITTGTLEIAKLIGTSTGSVQIGNMFAFLLNAGVKNFRTLVNSDTVHFCSNLVSGILNIGNTAVTSGNGGNTNIGTGSRCSVNIGNATNNSTAQYNGCCKINKLQVGSSPAMREVRFGTSPSGSSTGTITFSPAFPSGITPFVIASGVQASLTNQLFSVHTHTINNVSFQYAKTYIGFSGTTITGAGGALEPFSWIAISS
jgi:hypothetical protein